MIEIEESLPQPRIPELTVFTGLWGNPDHHRYRMFADMFLPFGVKGTIVGQGLETHSWEQFSQDINDALVSDNSPNRLLVGNSIGGSFLLKELFKNGLDFQTALLVGFDPSPVQRMTSFPEQQMQLWHQLGVSDEVAHEMISSEKIERPGIEINDAFKALKDDPRIIFIHGERDETIPVTEIKQLKPAQLITIEGMEHNSVREVDKAITHIMELVLKLPVRRIMKPHDILDLGETEFAGIIPFFSGNRIGWFAIGSGDFSILPSNLESEYTFIGESQNVPPHYTITADLGDRVFAINLDHLKNSGYKFYQALCPARSVYPDQMWVKIAHELNLATVDRRVQTGEDKRVKQLEEAYRNKAYAFMEGHTEVLGFMDEDNHLFSHLFDVYETLKVFGLTEEVAFTLSLLHDVGKGIQIRNNQLIAIEKLFRQEEVNPREIGIFRDFSGDALKSAISQQKAALLVVKNKYGILDEDILKGDRFISSKIVSKLPINELLKQGIIEYLSRSGMGINAKLVKLADLVSPYINIDYPLTWDIIQRSVEARLKATQKLYGSHRDPSEYIDSDIVEYFRNI